LIAEPLPSFFSFVDLHCKIIWSLFSHHIWLPKHFYPCSLLLIYVINCYIIIFSSYFIIEALLSFLSFIDLIVNRSIAIFSSYMNVETLPSFLSFVDLHCKELLSLFSHHKWLSNHFYHSSLLLIYTAKFYIIILSSSLIVEALSSFFSFVDSLCKTFLSLFYHHIWLRKLFYRSSLLLTLIIKHFDRYFRPLIYIVKSFYRYFLIINDCLITFIILLYCWFTL
jgi:hypothetical protein